MIDFKAIFDEHEIEYKDDIHGWINVECPICHHSGSRGYKGGFNITGSYFYCWNCGWHPIDIVFKKLFPTFNNNQIHSLLLDHSTEGEIKNKLNKRIKSPKVITLPCKKLESLGIKYLKRRNFNPSFLHDKYGVVGGAVTGNWAYRIIIPIYYHEQLVSYQGRSVFSKEYCSRHNILRYKNLSKENSIIDPKTILYNSDNCKKENVVITEGVFDVWRWGDGCLGSFGTSMTEEQLNYIAFTFSKIYFIFDPEKEAQKRAEHYANIIYGRAGHVNKKIEINIIDTQLSYDLADCTKEKINKMKKELGV